MLAAMYRKGLGRLVGIKYCTRGYSKWGRCVVHIPMSQSSKRESIISSTLPEGKGTYRDTGPESNSPKHSVPPLCHQILLILPDGNLTAGREQLLEDERNGKSGTEWPTDNGTDCKEQSSLVCSRSTGRGRCGRVEPVGISE